MIGQKIIIQFFGAAITSVITFLTITLTARAFGPNILGEVSYLLGIAGLILAFSDFGFSRAHIKFIADKKNIHKKIAVFLAVKTPLLLFCLLVAVFYFFFFLSKTTVSSKSTAFLILAVFEFFSRLGGAILLTFEGLQLIATQNMAVNISKLTKLLFLIILIFLPKSVIGLSSAYLIEGITLFFVSILLVKRFYPLKWDGIIFKNYFKYSTPFFVIYPLSYLQGNIDVIILRKFTSASTVGFYSAAVGLTSYLKSLYGTLITVFFPKMSELFAKKQFSKMQEYLDMAVKYLLVIFIPIFTGLFLFKNELINLILGKQFQPAANLFSLSMVGIFILMVSSCFDHILYASAKHKLMAPITLASTFLIIILQFILVPKTGAYGTIIANISGWFFCSMIQIYLVYKYLKIKFRGQNLVIIFLGIILIFFYSYLQTEQLGFLSRFLIYLASIISFYLLLLIIKIFTSQDKKYFLNLFNLKKIAQTGLSEF